MKFPRSQRSEQPVPALLIRHNTPQRRKLQTRLPPPVRLACPA